MEKSRIETLITRVKDSADLSKKNRTFLPLNCLELFGFTSNKNKILLAHLANHKDVNYMELGIFRGATIVPVALSDCNKCVGVDSFAYNPYRRPNWKADGYIEVENAVHDNLERYKVTDKTTIVKNNILDSIVEFENISNDNNLVYIDIEPIAPIPLKVKKDEEQKYKRKLTSIDYGKLLRNVFDSCEDNFILVIANMNSDQYVKMFNEILLKNKDIKVEDTTLLRNTHGARQDDGWYNGLGVFTISKITKPEKVEK